MKQQHREISYIKYCKRHRYFIYGSSDCVLSHNYIIVVDIMAAAIIICCWWWLDTPLSLLAFCFGLISSDEKKKGEIVRNLKLQHKILLSRRAKKKFLFVFKQNIERSVCVCTTAINKYMFVVICAIRSLSIFLYVFHFGTF